MAVTRVEYANNVMGQLCIGRLNASRGFQAWIIAEIGAGKADGGPNQGGKWNPLGTTLAMPGATNYNSVGVKNYTSFSQGIAAMVATLQENQYDALVATMQTENVTADQVFKAIDASPWGTSLDGLRAAYQTYQANKAFYDELPVGA